MNVYKSEKDIIQNLKDAGCSETQIQEIMKLYKINFIMEKHRNNVLNDVHKCEKQIDCIDYFIYQMKRGDTNEK